jgi:hypothetical protein
VKGHREALGMISVLVLCGLIVGGGPNVTAQTTDGTATQCAVVGFLP